jgi:fibronectin type 3 domain-containing protein
MMRRLLLLGLLLWVLPFPPQRQKSKHSVTLKWNAPVARPAQPVIGYNIYRGDKENGQYKLLAGRASSLTYTDAAVESGHTYYYQVTSIDIQGHESIPVKTKATVP